MLQKKNLRIHATLLSAEVNMSAIIGKQKTHQSGALSLPTYLYLPPSIRQDDFHGGTIVKVEQLYRLPVGSPGHPVKYAKCKMVFGTGTTSRESMKQAALSGHVPAIENHPAFG